MDRATSSSSTTNLSSDDVTILRALQLLEPRLKSRPIFTHSPTVKTYLRLQSHNLPHEAFAVMYLDAQTRLIAYERLFRGTLTRTSVYPREVVKQALAMNAASVILHHNHPSGLCSPSQSDIALTHLLQAALALVDVRVLDHIVTADDGAVSMAELGLL